MPRIGNMTSFPFLLVPGNRGKGWSLQITKTRKSFMLRAGLGMRIPGCTNWVGPVAAALLEVAWKPADNGGKKLTCSWPLACQVLAWQPTPEPAPQIAPSGAYAIQEIWGIGPREKEVKQEMIGTQHR